MLSIERNALYSFHCFEVTHKCKDNNVQASALIKEICEKLRTAAQSVNNADYTVVLRGDSTLRGHFPEASAFEIIFP